MKSLILDCSAGMSVYLDLDGKCLSKIDTAQNKHSDEVLKVVDELLVQANIKISQIDNMCVCVGPGSFTGVRVAISLAKGLSIGAKAKVFTLSNFDIFEIEKTENCYLVLDGFSNYVYVRKCENGVISDSCMDVQEFAEEQKQNNLLVFVTTEKTQKLLNKFEISAKFSKNQTICSFNKKIIAGENVALNQIYPVYLRASQAEIERAKKM